MFLIQKREHTDRMLPMSCPFQNLKNHCFSWRDNCMIHEDLSGKVGVNWLSKVVASSSLCEDDCGCNCGWRKLSALGKVMIFFKDFVKLHVLQRACKVRYQLSLWLPEIYGHYLRLAILTLEYVFIKEKLSIYTDVLSGIYFVKIGKEWQLNYLYSPNQSKVLFGAVIKTSACFLLMIILFEVFFFLELYVVHFTSASCSPDGRVFSPFPS